MSGPDSESGGQYCILGLLTCPLIVSSILGVMVARATRGDNKADHHSSQLQPRPGQHTINHQPPVLLLGIITHSLVASSCTNTGYGCINPVNNVDMVPQQRPLQSCCFSFLLLGSLHEERPRTLALVVLGSLCRPSVNTSTIASHQQGGGS